MKKHLIAIGTQLLVLFIFLGGLWVGLVRWIPAGLPRSIITIGLGLAVLICYVWLLTARVRVIMEGSSQMAMQGIIAVTEIAAMLLSFGAVYHQLGIIDNTRIGSPIVHEFWTSVYYSVVTFTTLGYGDFYPHGVGRALAGMQALTGYVTLALLASATASVISPHSAAGKGRSEQDHGNA